MAEKVAVVTETAAVEGGRVEMEEAATTEEPAVRAATEAASECTLPDTGRLPS